MARLSEEKIQLIRETYAKVGTYSATAKIVGSSPATVKKYVTEDEPVRPRCEKVLFSKNIPDILPRQQPLSLSASFEVSTNKP